jgi:outer mitochondrial transmembrane helix translocase
LVWNDVVFPHQIQVDFEQIGGLDKEKELIYSHVVLPFRRPELFSSARSRLLSWPSGILLYGPPGTGKTMLAKAIARQSDTVFINVRVSSLFSKWVGETEKYTAAVFSLAHKLAPAIIFIDELDTLFQQRAGHQTELSLRVKAQFMTLWDGITGQENSQVMVIGATNRPAAVDPAILRRLSQRIMIGMPDAAQRQQILRKVLTGEPLDSTVDLAHFARLTAGYSGSDLKNLCQTAARFPLDDFINKERGLGLHGTQVCVCVCVCVRV